MSLAKGTTPCSFEEDGNSGFKTECICLLDMCLILTATTSGKVGMLDNYTIVTGRGPTYKIDPNYMGEVFRDYLMPLTKDSS
eukprot:5301562-Amphidinium_carterae.1